MRAQYKLSERHFWESWWNLFSVQCLEYNINFSSGGGIKIPNDSQRGLILT